MNCSRWALIRFTGYMLAIGAVLEGIVLVQPHLPASYRPFREGHFIEWTQFGLLLASAFILFAASIRVGSSRQLYQIMALLPLMAAVRELDNTFDNWIGKGAWGTTCFAIAVTIVFLAFRARNVLREQGRRLVAQCSFGYLASSVFLVMVISRILGQKAFWKNYLPAKNYAQDIPRAVEELCELAGYLLLFCGVLELFIASKPAVPEHRIEPTDD